MLAFAPMETREKDPPVNSSEFPPRYSRQMLFKGIGVEGQLALSSARVALVGCGALGSFQASLLVRAGVGMLRVIDRDFLEASNLQRQILFDEQDVRELLPKAIAAERKLRAVNSLVKVEGVVEDLNPATITRLLDGFDLILDATDNFDVRFLVNDYAIKQSVPWIYGACVGAEGLAFPILPGETACLRCVFENAPPPGLVPTCDTAGVIGPIVGTVASFQVAEALKLLTGHRDQVNRRIFSMNLWANRQAQLAMPARDPDCPCCGKHQFPYLEGALGAETAILCGRHSVQIRRPDSGAIDLVALAARWTPLAVVEKNRFLVRANIDGYVLSVFADGRAIIGGTNDPGVAKSLYARYVGA